MKFQDVLRQEYEKRAAKNPHYTQNSFARDIGLSRSRLSEVFSGKQGLSPAVARKISTKLKLVGKEKDLFISLVESKHARSKIAKELALKKVKSLSTSVLKSLSFEKFKVISSWYHLAILELVSREGFKWDSQIVSEKIGISIQLVDEVKKRLLSNGLLEYGEGEWKKCTDSLLSISSDVPSVAIRNYHEGVLNQAIRSIENDDVSERNFSSLILNIDSEQYDEAINMIIEFRREFNRRFGQPKKGNRLYNIAIQFFPMEKKI